MAWKDSNEFRIEGAVVCIKLTQGKETCVDLRDWRRVREHRWWAVKGNAGAFYAVSFVSGKRVKLHQFVIPDSGAIDHRDGNGLNNCRNNLRPATQAQNTRNRKRPTTNTSGFKGVYPVGKKWAAQVKRIYLGIFDTPIEAAKAYNEAAIKEYGEFARLNSIN